MPGNPFGRLLRATSFGEGHGTGIGCMAGRCLPGMMLSALDIQGDLDRRQPGTSRFVTHRKEGGTVEIACGVFEGRATGTPTGTPTGLRA